jgi:hypothetical protein
LDDKFAAILESAGIIKVYGKTYMLMHNPTLRNMINVIVYVTQELLDFVVLFIHSITGTEPGDIDRSLSHAEATPAESYAKASIDMPHLRGGIYDLKKFLVIKMVSGLKFKVDQIKYHSSDVSEFLESIFSAASVSPRGVLFMPYFVCTYRSLDVKGLRRREFLIAPKFIEEEDKEKEGKKAKKTVYGKPEGLKFDRVPYRVIK